jgi:hypothetical protein
MTAWTLMGIQQWSDGSTIAEVQVSSDVLARVERVLLPSLPYADAQTATGSTILGHVFAVVDAATWEASVNPAAGEANDVVPAEVPQWQARRALLDAGLLDAVEAAVAAATRDVQIVWEYAPNIVRNSPFIAAMGPALGLSDAQIDALFIAARRIT